MEQRYVGQLHGYTMSNLVTYCHLYSRCPDPNEYEVGWHGSAYRPQTCAGCGTLSNPARAVDVVLSIPPFKTDLNCLFNFVPFVISVKLRRFLDQYGLSEILYFGKVLDSSNVEYADYCTVNAARVVYMRGNHRSTLRRCEMCGTILHFPVSPRYLLRRDYEALNGAPVAMSQVSLIIRSDLWKDGLKDGREWRHLAIEKLPVRDEPLDGFPENLEDFDKEVRATF